MAERILISDVVRNTWLSLSNRWRLLRHREDLYVVLRIGGSYPERPMAPRRPFPLSLLPWPSPPPSVQAFVETLERAAEDSRLKGVVLLISELTAEPATLCSMRQALARFRAAGKRLVGYLKTVDTWSYYLAVGCNEIVAPEGATFGVTGLWSETVFLKDTLATLGIEADFESIAEYKVSPDMFRRAHMTEAHREMLESLLDSLYDELTSAIADGRSTTSQRVRKLLDTAPLTAKQAQEAGLLDQVAYEDELPRYLGNHESPASLVPWEQAEKILVRPRRWRSRQRLGIISLEGVIVSGPSRRSPLPIPLPLPMPSSQAGADTLTSQIRAVARDKRVAAVILHIDSPGGSALASDLIWREILLLNRRKPVVVYMNNVAASGGYYVSTAASAIFAQPTTLTGSIGIWGGKFVTRGLFEQLHAGRETVSRGKAAGLYTDGAPFDDEERAKIQADLAASYNRFTSRVAEGRKLTSKEVEVVARGRVWTGQQAAENGLVDHLGDLKAAARKARDLAGISERRYLPLQDIPARKRYQPPQPFPEAISSWMTGLNTLLHEGSFALAPWQVRIRG
jgi:protease-4